MISLNDNQGSGGQGFLPEDYLREKHERRTNIIGLVLFGVVMFGVAAAFFVTNREWESVKAEQERVNREYAAETRKISQLHVLEDQKAEMLEKAEITTALLERVPRSVLLAELINRMPDELTLTELGLEGTRSRAPRETSSARSGSRSFVRGSEGDGSKGDEPEIVPPPSYTFELELVGLAGSDQQVADYERSLQECPLLENVEMISTKEHTVEDVALRQFKIEAWIRRDADARHIEPLRIPRGRVAELPKTTPLPMQRMLEMFGFGGEEVREASEAAGEEPGPGVGEGGADVAGVTESGGG